MKARKVSQFGESMKRKGNKKTLKMRLRTRRSLGDFKVNKITKLNQDFDPRMRNSVNFDTESSKNPQEIIKVAQSTSVMKSL